MKNEGGQVLNKNGTFHSSARIEENRIFETEMKQALSNKELILHYQPQVDITNGKVTGIEALVRWNHPEKGLIYPNDFIPLVETTNYIKSIDEHVLTESCQQIKLLQNDGYSDLKVGVNISANQFEDPSFVDKIKRILDKTELDPHFLELEITEHIVIKPTKATVKKMLDLKRIGIRFSIDDFGTGYSSLGYLRDFPFDTIKIDRSFIHRITSDTVNNYIVESIVNLGKKLNLRVIAEGVETEEQLSHLKDLKVKEIQGYVYSKPVQYDSLKGVLKQLLLKN